jgi:hypothetical protein
MDGNFAGRRSNLGSVALGALLIFLGCTFLLGQLAGQIFHFDLGRTFWPLCVILPGTVLLGLALLTDTELSEPLAILGGIAAATGLLLFFQNATGLWASWAYAWALAVPGGAGLGLVLFGLVRVRPEKVRAGTRLLTAAGSIFIVGAIFFELVLGVNGFGLGRLGWPLLLIGLGLLALLRTLWPHQPHLE